MKAAKVVLIVLCCALIINWVRGGEDFHWARVLPLMGGHHPGIYDVAAVVLLLVMLPWGLRRLRRRGEELPENQDTWSGENYWDSRRNDVADDANTEGDK